MAKLDTLQPMDDPAQQIADAIIERPALIFAGQGAQKSGMGKDLAEADPDAMAYWKEGERISGLPLREICWDGKEEDLQDTRVQQPALTIVNQNLWNSFAKRHHITPCAVAGHSLGELSAIGAAGVLSPADLLQVASLRGRLMAEADPGGTGAMAAIVRLESSLVEELVAQTSAESGEMIVAANYNTPVQTVVSGTRTAIGLICEKARQQKAVAVELKVSGAFHSPLMAEANREFQILLDRLEWHRPSCPVYSNVSAKAAMDAETVKKNIWQQMISPVFWVNLIRNLYLAGVRWWMEISPRAVLGKMIGPSVAGLTSHADALRVDLVNSLSSILNYTV